MKAEADCANVITIPRIRSVSVPVVKVPFSVHEPATLGDGPVEGGVRFVSSL